MSGLGKTLILIGVVLVVVGAVFSLAGKLPWLGHLPGDITIQRERLSVPAGSLCLQEDAPTRAVCPREKTPRRRQPAQRRSRSMSYPIQTWAITPFALILKRRLTKTGWAAFAPGLPPLPVAAARSDHKRAPSPRVRAGCVE